MILWVLLCVAISLLLAWSLIRRRKALQGVILGLAPIAVMEAIMQGALQLRIQRCLERACVAKGLPAECGLTEFGCTEWSIPSAIFLGGAGLVALTVSLAKEVSRQGIRVNALSPGAVKTLAASSVPGFRDAYRQTARITPLRTRPKASLSGISTTRTSSPWSGRPPPAPTRDWLFTCAK